MKELAIEIQDAGGEEEWLAQAEVQEREILRSIESIDRQRSYINRGGNFDSEDEIDEAIADLKKELEELRGKKAYVKHILGKDHSRKTLTTEAYNPSLGFFLAPTIHKDKLKAFLHSIFTTADYDASFIEIEETDKDESSPYLTFDVNIQLDSKDEEVSNVLNIKVEAEDKDVKYKATLYIDEDEISLAKGNGKFEELDQIFKKIAQLASNELEG